jgi:hypothetical protein
MANTSVQNLIINHVTGKELLPRINKENVKVWIIGPTLQYVTGVLQPIIDHIPSEYIGKITRRAGTQNGIDRLCLLKGNSIEFKSSREGRESFQGSKPDIIWIDGENIEEDIVSECRLRLPKVLYRTWEHYNV